MNEVNNLEYLQQKSKKPFGVKDKLGYLFGDFGNDFMFIFANMYFMIFYTKVLGVSSAMVGTCFLVSRFVDAFSDIAMGRIVDKCQPTKDGKFRCWIKRIAGPVAIMNFLMYQYSLANASMTIKVAVMFVTYLLWGSVFYTAINIPYGSMASVITADTQERASLSTWRSMGASCASVVIGSITPQLVYSADAAGNQIINPERFTLVAGVFSVAAFICYILCFVLTTERIEPQAKEPEEKLSLVETFKALGTSRSMVSIIAITIVLILSQFMGQTINTYLFIDYFNDVNALSLLSMIGLPINLIIAAGAAKLAKNYGKREVGMIGVFIGGVVYLAMYFMDIKNAYQFLIAYAIATFGITMFNMLLWAFITDVIDDNEVRTGERNDGTTYGVYSFTRKLAQALTGAVSGYALTFIGYNSIATTQTESVKHGLYVLSTVWPGVGYILVGLLLMFAYPLTKKVVEDNGIKLSSLRK